MLKTVKRTVESLHGPLSHILHRRVKKLVIATAYNPSFSEVAQLTVPRMQQYAKRYGYEVRVATNVECERHPVWIKIIALRKLLEGEFDFVFWVDADALIVRQDIQILSTVVSGADLYLAWLGPETTDWQAPPGLVGHFNAGVMLVRVSDWSREFFAQVWEVGRVPMHWRDQGAMLHLLGYDHLLGIGREDIANPNRNHLARLDPIWNSVPGVAMAPDPVIHHYAGVGNKGLWLDFIRNDLEASRSSEEMSAAARQDRSKTLSSQARALRT